MQALATTSRPRNMERFMSQTGKTEAEYQQWASQVGRQMHINNLDRLICVRMNIYTVAHLPQFPTLLPEGMETTEQETTYLLEHSENPLELARVWQSLRIENEMYLSVETVLSEYLRPFPKENFERFGDRNHLADVSKSWFKKGSVELDVQIDEINSMAPLQVSIEDAIEFVKSWKPGAFVSPLAWQVDRAEERFFALTTFKIKDYYVEHLLRMSMLTVPALAQAAPF